MPGMFIAFIVVAAIGLLYLLGTTLFSRQYRHNNLLVGKSVLGVSALLLVLSCFTLVGTQDVGVLVAFGHPEGGLSNGLHFKAPWDDVVKLDGKVQTDTYASNGYNGSDQKGAQDGCINVRIARQATACVNVTIRWQLDKSGVDYLFRNYRDNDNIRDNLLHRDLQTAVNVAFAHYDPLALDTNGNSTQPTSADLSASVLEALHNQVGKYLIVSQIYIPLFNFDPDTQKRLNGLQQQVAQTRIAQQSIQTAAATAQANEVLARSVSHNPNVLVSRCLDILNEAVQKGQALPAGFSCFPGSGSGVAIAVK